MLGSVPFSSQVSAKYTLKEGVLNDEEHRGKLLYCQPGTWAVESKAYCQQPVSNKVMRCAFDGKAQLLAVGFSAGVLMLFEMPQLQALQTLSLGQEPLDAVALGANGDWLAVVAQAQASCWYGNGAQRPMS